MNIVIVGTGFSFPDGTGSTARVIAFAKGMMRNGALVNVFCPKPTENKKTGLRNIQLKGVYENIPFEYTCGQRLIANTRIGALLLYVKGLFRTCFAIQRIQRKKPVDAILLWYAEAPLNFIFFKILAKSIGAVLILEKSEYPYVYCEKTLSVRMMMMFYERITLKSIDGVIVISEFLREYFYSHLVRSDRILKIPILVDTDRFNLKQNSNKFVKHKIIYCGNLEHQDEVTELLKAFGQISNEFPLWTLEIIGPLPDLDVIATLNLLAIEKGIVDRVIFAGAVSRNKIPTMLLDGDIMVLPRASGTFSMAGFPTKLGEYLATGKPVVVTATGCINEYLLDRVSAYLVKPDDVNAFAEVLRYVIYHYNEAIEVGNNGRNVAIREFDSNVQSKRILNFIAQLHHSRNRITS